MPTPTANQIKVLQMVKRRDWPAGEPRIDWIDKRSRKNVVEAGWIAERPDTAGKYSGNIVDLTPAGEAVLVAAGQQ